MSEDEWLQVSAPPCRGEEPGGGEKTGREKTYKTQNPHSTPPPPPLKGRHPAAYQAFQGTENKSPSTG